jgi:phosphatidylglycerol:prolipoprotein diacylglycerol transferase
MFPILQIGPLAIRLPGLLLIGGLWLSLILVEREASRREITDSLLSNLIFFALIAGLVGARLGHALHYLDAYLQNPLAFVSLNPDALAPLEGIVAAGLVAWIYAQRKCLPLWPTLDALAPGFSVFAVFVGFAHLSSGDAFGAPANLPWAIELWGERRHPSQIYEILAAALILLLVWRSRRWTMFSGFLFLEWSAASALGRLILEVFRGDSLIVLGSLRGAQVASAVALLVSLGVMHVLARRATSKAEGT